jgi:hypothetical protein
MAPVPEQHDPRVVNIMETILDNQKSTVEDKEYVIPREPIKKGMGSYYIFIALSVLFVGVIAFSVNNSQSQLADIRSHAGGFDATVAPARSTEFVQHATVSKQEGFSVHLAKNGVAVSGVPLEMSVQKLGGQWSDWLDVKNDQGVTLLPKGGILVVDLTHMSIFQIGTYNIKFKIKYQTNESAFVSVTLTD